MRFRVTDKDIKKITPSPNFELDQMVVWFLSIVNFLLFVLLFLTIYLNWGGNIGFLKTLSTVFFFSTFLIILNDIFNHNIYKKVFWVISIIILPPIMPVIYMIQRDKLIRLGNRFKSDALD